VATRARYRIVFTAAWMLVAWPALFGQGTTAFEFLRNDVGARAAALGGSFLTSSDDPNLLFSNPAGLATLSTRRVSVGFFKHLLDINSGSVSFGTEIPRLGFIGAGVNYINYGEFKRTGEEGQDLGTFGAGDLSLTAGYASELRAGLTYGVAAKFIYSAIAEAHSTAGALDFGLQYAAVPGRVVVGASVLNLGTQFNPYVSTREPLPLDVQIGASVAPEHLPAVIMLSFHKLNEDQDNFGKRLKQFIVGVEFTASPNVLLRVGYNNERRQELKIGQSSGLAGFSIGGGILTGAYTIDYAFTSYGKIGSVHRISIAL
jgi:hypothetical protein